MDVVWNALHGSFGEDGQVQKLLDHYGIPYTGSGSVTSALAFNKQQAKEQVQALGIKTPPSILVMPEGTESVNEVTQRIYYTMAPPWVVKPLRGGSSVQTFFAQTPLELSQIVEESISHGEPFIVEQYIIGREAAVGVINNFRNKEDYTLPVLEIKSPPKGILHHDIRTNESEPYAVLGKGFKPEERELLSDLAKKIHTTFGAEDYSQSEFIIDSFGRVWFIEFDTHPSLHTNAPFLVALEAVGATMQEFVKAIIDNKK
jgi:D-alanine-D-alanine ligase